MDNRDSNDHNDLISRKAVLNTLERIFADYRMAWKPTGRLEGFASAVPTAIMGLPCAIDNNAQLPKNVKYTEIGADFVKAVSKLKTRSATAILNTYRNFYFCENNNTERGIVAYAINDVLVQMHEMENDVQAESSVDFSAYKQALLQKIDEEIVFAKKCHMPEMVMGMNQIKSVIVDFQPPAAKEEEMPDMDR